MKSTTSRLVPSPGMLIAITALVFALAGTAIAGHQSSFAKITKSKVRSIAGAVVESKASGLSVNSANTATNAQELGGVPASGYTRPTCDAGNGAVKGFAKVASDGTVESAYNCSGGAVTVTNSSAGHYDVTFPGNPGLVAVSNAGLVGRVVAVNQGSSGPGSFSVDILNLSSAGVNTRFMIVVP